MSDQEIEPRVKVHKAFVHPVAPGGVPLGVSMFNLVFLGVTLGILHWLPGGVIAALVQLTFAWFGRKGPYYLRYHIRNYWRPITYLDT